MRKTSAVLLSFFTFATNGVAGALDVLSPNTVVPNACVYANTGVYSDGFVMVPIYEDIIYTCERGYYLPRTSETCVICPANHFCPGGEYTYSETDDVGINACPDGASAPTGMWDASQCSGAKLHLGKDVLYLSPVKRTSPALHFDTNHDGVADLFGNMTTADVPMNKDTDKKLKIRYKGTVYSVYDDTVQVTE